MQTNPGAAAGTGLAPTIRMIAALDALVVAWLQTATIRPMATSAGDLAPLVLVVNDSVPPREAWTEISRRAACGAFPGDEVLTYLLVSLPNSEDGLVIPTAFHTETVHCGVVPASSEDAPAPVQE